MKTPVDYTSEASFLYRWAARTRTNEPRNANIGVTDQLATAQENRVTAGIRATEAPTASARQRTIAEQKTWNSTSQRMEIAST
ncbi:MAG: hypothetical protein HY566_02695 [Candidatus Kerfeldbacteria bacterium]|nr:hypothetical protein [Candidatus Kerfeldbacteria bacterium]